MTPKHPREKISFSLYEPPDHLKNLDLPWYGGQISRASATSMTVSYSDDEATPEQLKQWWPEALEANGIAVTNPSESGNGAYTAILKSGDGKTGTLTIRPEGTLWWVIISL